MKNIEIDKDKMQVTTSRSLKETYEELEKYYRGNDELLKFTFPIMVFSEESSVHKKRFLGCENELHFYANHPWTFNMTKT